MINKNRKLEEKYMKNLKKITHNEIKKQIIVLVIWTTLLFLGFLFLANYLFINPNNNYLTVDRDVLLTQFNNLKYILNDWINNYNFNNLENEKENAKKYKTQITDLKEKIKNLKETDNTIITKNLEKQVKMIEIHLLNLSVINNEFEAKKFVEILKNELKK